MLRKWIVSAPSNIALIKYMGKEDSSLNLPANSSLSMTLDQLCTWVEIERNSFGSDGVLFIPELPRELDRSFNPTVPALKEAGVQRMIRHVKRVQESVHSLFPQYGLTAEAGGQIEIRTANTFPASSGIASSASSFAAVTLASALAFCKDPDLFQKIWQGNPEFKRDLAQISRQGSGSSCRSFEGPWVLWEGATATPVKSALPEMTDLVLLISRDSKEISSSEAHSLVRTSPLWEGRVARAQERIGALRTALASGDRIAVSKIAWTEMWEMHSLFHTCEVPFTYWEPDTIRVLRWLRGILTSAPEWAPPPIVTLDAGPNIHLIVESSQAAEWKGLLKEKFPDLPLLEDTQGSGVKAVY